MNCIAYPEFGYYGPVTEIELLYPFMEPGLRDSVEPEHTEMVADHKRNIGLAKNLYCLIESEIAGHAPTGTVRVSPVDRQKRHMDAMPA